MFSNIYLNANPKRGSEIVQYNYVICTATQTYPWWEVLNQFDSEVVVQALGATETVDYYG